jgi:hypothetical protein
MGLIFTDTPSSLEKATLPHPQHLSNNGAIKIRAPEVEI